MPIYNYKCSCGYEFEALNKIENREYASCKNPKGCPRIGKIQLSAPKGINGGFYDKNVKVYK